MTGKEFFGRLLNNNRQERESPWTGDDRQGAPEVDVYPSELEQGGPSPDVDAPHPQEDPYVDAPVTELETPDSDEFTNTLAQHDAPHPDRNTPVDRGHIAAGEDDAPSITTTYDPSAHETEHSEAEAIPSISGDGIGSPIPDVSPSPVSDPEAEVKEPYGDDIDARASADVDGFGPPPPSLDQISIEIPGLSGIGMPDEEGHDASDADHDPPSPQSAETPHIETPGAHAETAAPATSSAPDVAPAPEPAPAPSTERIPAPDATPAPAQTLETPPVPETAPAPEAHPVTDSFSTPETPPASEAAPVRDAEIPVPENRAPEPQPGTEAHASSAPQPAETGAIEPDAPKADVHPEVNQREEVVPPSPQPAEAPAANHEPQQVDEKPVAEQEPEAAAQARDTEVEQPVIEEPAEPKAADPKSEKLTDAELRSIKDRVVTRLLEKKIVTHGQVKSAIRERGRQNLKATLWRILAQQTGVDREQVYREAALTYAFVERKIEEGSIDLEFVRQVADVFPEKKRNRLIELRIVPIGYEFEPQTQMLRVVFITHDPSLPAVREVMQDLNLERYELQYSSESTVKDLLARAFPKKNEYLERMSNDPLAYDLGATYEDEKSELIDEDALEAEINRSSLINLFEGALVEAVHRGASDIHIYPNARRQIEIHFRVDGRLFLWHTEDKVHPESLLAVIKDNTMNVDRFERDMAQDGFIQRKVDDALIRYRVSILPIATAQSNIHAESIVIRVLDDRKVITDLSRLGLLEGALERFDMAIRQPHGMVILTGPTGSGKSTTLVAALHQVVTPEVNVLTVEDPVEYIIPGVRQIKLNHKLGLEGALRAILRHDPDVVMVGEMRDRETAELAVKLANTGHLTFSTLHTNDAPSAVSRLYKMGVEPFLIAYAINLVVAQRLLRNVCPTCKTVDDDPDPVLLKRLGFTDEDLATHTIYKASSDPKCKTCKGVGYKGRRAISEALYFSREIRHLIVESDRQIDEDGLRTKAREQGMLTLQDSAREVVKMGETTVDEMMRVTMTED